MPPHTYRISSAEEMIRLGGDLAHLLEGQIVAFNGDLGAGKTTLIKGILSTLCDLPINDISSPTFNILHLYRTHAHFDCYRLRSAHEFLAMGLDEMLRNAHTSLIEWPNRIASILPSSLIHVDIAILDAETREVQVYEN